MATPHFYIKPPFSGLFPFLAKFWYLPSKKKWLKGGFQSWKVTHCPFSNLLHIGHIAGGSVIWPMCNILHIVIKRKVILWCGWVFTAHLKLIKPHICWQDVSYWWMGGVHPTSQPNHFYFNFILFVLIGHMLTLILIDVQYLQNVGFSFEKVHMVKMTPFQVPTTI